MAVQNNFFTSRREFEKGKHISSRRPALTVECDVGSQKIVSGLLSQRNGTCVCICMRIFLQGKRNIDVPDFLKNLTRIAETKYPPHFGLPASSWWRQRQRALCYLA